MADLPVDAMIGRYRRHLDQLFETQRIDATFTALAAINGYAWRRARRIEASPCVSAESYGVLLHEAGHIVDPCSRHPDPTVSKGGPCVACEIRAWEWAIATGVEWTPSMQRELSFSLATYREHNRLRFLGP